MVTAEKLYEKLKAIHVGNPICQFTKENCELLLPAIERIEKLKHEKNAIILAHNYVAPQIFYSVADYTGDSYGLSKKAKESDADVIVFAAVRFMAETAKILNPKKIVLDPNPNGGCSLADGITNTDVINLRQQFPDHTFVCYINTTASVKAECDVCVTSSNVYKIIEKIPNDKIYFLPDKLMGENVIQNLKTKGVKKSNGEELPQVDILATLIMPDGFKGKKFLVYNNFKIIKKYNNSNYYALSVGLLSDGVAY